MRPAVRALRLCAFVAMFAWIAVVTARRGGSLVAGGRGALDGVEELRWMAWSHRDPALIGLFARAQGELAPGEAVFLLCPPDAAPDFLVMMAEYGLPGQVVAGAWHENDPGRARPTKVQRTADGVRVVPRSATEPRDGSR